MKGSPLMPGFTSCTAEESATTETTGCSKKTCISTAPEPIKDAAKRNVDSPQISERRVRSRLQDSELSAGSVRKEDVNRTIRPTGGKDRHSKVNTSKGPRDRRVRLSVSTAIQFYDVQDRLGYDQPSKAVEWLIKKAKTAIDELPPLPVQGSVYRTSATESSIIHSASRSLAPGMPSSEQGVPSCIQLTSSALVTQASNSTPTENPRISSLFATTGAEKSEKTAIEENTILKKESFGMEAYPLISQADNGRTYATGEFSKLTDTGSPSARVELRTKARERARERVKGKFSVKDPDAANASCITLPPSSDVHDPVWHHSPYKGSCDQHNASQTSPHVDQIIREFIHQSFLENQILTSSFKDVSSNLANNIAPEQVKTLLMHVPRHTSTTHATASNLLCPSSTVLQENQAGFHQKSHVLPNFLHLQAPVQNWSQTSTLERFHGLHCSARGSLHPTPFVHSSMPSSHNNYPFPASCSSAVSQLAVIGVPISNLTGAIIPSERMQATPSMTASIDHPSYSAAFRPALQPITHGATLQEWTPLDCMPLQRVQGAQPSAYSSKLSDIQPNNQAAASIVPTPSSAFEPCNNQFHRPLIISSRASSGDFHVHDHGNFDTRNLERLHHGIEQRRISSRLGDLDDIEAQLKCSISSGTRNITYHGDSG